MKNKQRCEKLVWKGWHGYPCRIPATVERGGKHYCRIHDPVYIEKKEQARRERFSLKYDNERLIFERQSLYEQILGGKTIPELKELLKEAVK